MNVRTTDARGADAWRNALAGRVVYGFGDSLIDGHTLGVGLLDGLGSRCGMSLVNGARNGATILPRAEDDPTWTTAGRIPDVAAQVEAGPDAAPDCVVFDGLVNDATKLVGPGHRRIGALAEGYEGGFDRTTFTGAFEHVCLTIRRRYPETPALYVAAHRMPCIEPALHDALEIAADAVCAKWSIPVIDVYREGTVNTRIESFRRRYSYDLADRLHDGSGTHLTPEGYERFYLPMIVAALTAHIPPTIAAPTDRA